MAAPRVFVVHELAHVRELMTGVLSGAGFNVETPESTYETAARFVDEKADLLVLGMTGLEARDLELVRALKREAPGSAILVSFAPSQRELAVAALQAGADGYLIEPFYTDELLRLVQAQFAPAPKVREEVGAGMPPLVREVAHAVNNPLQVLTLLLEDERIIKKKLIREARSEVERIRAVVGHLMEYSSLDSMKIEALDPGPLVEDAVRGSEVHAESFRFVTARGELPKVMADATGLATALHGLMEAVSQRTDEKTAYDLEARASGEQVAFRLVVPRALFNGEEPAHLRESVFVVREDRRVLPGLALSRALLEAQGGSLKIRETEAGVELEARLRRA